MRAGWFGSESGDNDWSSAPLAVARINVLLPGLYVWLTTVFWPVLGVPWGLIHCSGFGALASLALGVFWLDRRSGLARVLGIYCFTGFCVVTWALAREVFSAELVDPVLSGFGAVGWGFFAFGWGIVRRPRDVPERDPRSIPSARLTPYAALPRLSGPLFGALLLVALLPVLSAWRVSRLHHALLAQVVGVAGAALCIGIAAHIAISLGKWQPPPSVDLRFRGASTELTLLALLVGVGILLRLL